MRVPQERVTAQGVLSQPLPLVVPKNRTQFKLLQRKTLSSDLIAIT
jgi:hypothetical protein